MNEILALDLEIIQPYDLGELSLLSRFIVWEGLNDFLRLLSASQSQILNQTLIMCFK